MGIEYSHGLFVADLNWKPTWAHFEAVHGVLTKWKLAKKTGHEIFDLDADDMITAKKAAKQLPANLMAMFGGVRGKTVVEVMGDSQYEIAPAERYIETLMLVFGVDIILLSDKAYPVKVQTPPKDGKTVLEGEASATLGPGQVRYPASWTTTPPKTKAPGKWPGVWRSGLVIGCNKDVPAIAERNDPLPAKGFRDALEKALGTKLVEHGWQH